MGKQVLLAGASGLVGSGVLPLLLDDDRVSKVITVGRRPLQGTYGKREQWVGRDLLKVLRPAKVDAVICCLGTTIRKAGSQAAFIAVDKDLPVGIGKWAKEQGAATYVLVSAIGANARSRIFYSRVKGEVEEALEALHFASLMLMQPSVLSGPRQERRRAEALALAVFRAAGPLFAGSLRKYRLMPHHVLAKALVEAALEPRPGVHRAAYREIMQLAERFRP